MKRITLAILGLFLIQSIYAGEPISREAILVESAGPSEVIIMATGIGKAPKKTKKKNLQKELTKKAILDSKRAAIWFVIQGGADPMLSTSDEKLMLMSYNDQLYSKENIQRYISWEADGFEERRKIDGGKKLRIKKAYKINKRIIAEDLTKWGVMKATSDIADELGLPMIMVLPEVQKGQNPIDELRANKNLKQAAQVIEGYLTSRRYDVIVPEQAEGLNELVSASQSLKDVEEDQSYLLALSIGSDIYITYTVQIDEKRVGSSTTRKAAVGVRAYETTTGRLLGTETGYSYDRPSMAAVVIEEAINDAIDKVLTRVTAYWKDDLDRGLQYKLIVSVSTDFDADEAEEILFDLQDVVDEMSKKTKEVLMTDYTLDYLIWVSPEKYSKSSRVYRKVKKTLENSGDGISVKKVTLNKKLIVLNLQYE